MTPTPPGWPRLSAALFCADPAAAIDWYERALGFETRIRVEHDGVIQHSELTYGEALVMVAGVRPGSSREAAPSAVGGRNTASLFLYVDDVDAHCERARAAGGHIATEPAVSDYGPDYWADRGYELIDPEGHRWWFAERLRTG